MFSYLTWMYVILSVVLVTLLPGNEGCDISKCAVPECDSPILKEGKCCPECPCEYNGMYFDIEDLVDRGDNCEVCECTKYGVECLSMKEGCPPSYCEHNYIKEGECCPTCACMVDGLMYDVGFQILNKDPCEDCRCGYDGKEKCNTMTCPKPQCSHPYTPRRECCKQCGCHRGKEQFDFGPVPRKDECSPECVCQENGKLKCKPLGYVCDRAPCTKKLRYTPPGQCCEKCKCSQGGKMYNPGDDMPIPSSQTCSTRCYCGDAGKRICDDVMCPQLECSNPVSAPRDCCPSCGCLQKKTLFPFGPILDDPCQPCECHSNGTITCDRRQRCPNSKPCRSGIYVPENGTAECCPKCRCKLQGKYYAPGSVFDGPTCQTCECHATSGRVSCEKRPPCPAEPLMCVNPTQDKASCKATCGDGPSCRYKHQVIKYGTYKTFRKVVCTCLGDPWFPNAFCAPREVNEKHIAALKPLLAEYGYPADLKKKVKGRG